MKGVSVIICCYNSGDKLIPTLSHLAKQETSPGLPYEIIIVDNNCNDHTIAIASKTWFSLGSPFSLVITRQPLAGLNHARLMGIQTSQYDYVVLCDDDNWLCNNYLLKVNSLFDALPGVGLVGGVGEAVADIPLPQWFNELKGFGYAVGTEGRDTGPVEFVYGAGMALRKSALNANGLEQPRFFLSDRKGESLSSGGDTEICMIIKNADHTIYFDAGLTFKHYLSSGRLQWNYYVRLRKSFGRAAAYLQMYNSLQVPEINLQKKSRRMQFFSLAKLMLRHLKYILFPFFFKNARCANVLQQISMQITSFSEAKALAWFSSNVRSSKKKRPGI